METVDLNRARLEQFNEENEVEEDNEIMETISDKESAEDPYSDSVSEPDWDCENVSFNHRFQADEEEREGCPLTPQLRLVITEDPEQALDIHEEELGHSDGE